MESAKNKIPLGLRWMRVFSIISIILFLLISISTSTLLKINFLTLSGVIGALSSLLALATSVLLLYSINRPSKTLYKILIGILYIGTLFGLLRLYPVNLGSVVQIFSTIFTIFLIWYLYKVKSYFLHGHIDVNNPAVKKADKIFKVFFTICIIILAISILIVPLFAAIYSVNNGRAGVERGRVYVQNFMGKTFDQNASYCKSLSDKSNECLTSLIAQYWSEKKPINIQACSLFSTETAKNQCYAMLQRCDLATGGDVYKKFCGIDARQYQQLMKEDAAK